jgi:hypothetical protein
MHALVCPIPLVGVAHFAMDMLSGLGLRERKGLNNNKGYGKDSFLGQPYEPFKSLKLFL